MLNGEDNVVYMAPGVPFLVYLSLKNGATERKAYFSVYISENITLNSSINISNFSVLDSICRPLSFTFVCREKGGTYLSNGELIDSDT